MNSDNILLFEAYKRIYTEARSVSKTCIMALLNKEDKQPILDFIQCIEGNDLYTKQGDNSYGKEFNSHVTILYGLEPNIEFKPIKDIINKKYSKGQIGIKIRKMSIFDSKEYDVLKLDVESGDLRKLNKILKQFPYDNDYPIYKPHLTLAYLKKGVYKKYINKIFDDKEYNIDVIEVSYGDDRPRRKLKLS